MLRLFPILVPLVVVMSSSCTHRLKADKKNFHGETPKDKVLMQSAFSKDTRVITHESVGPMEPVAVTDVAFAAKTNPNAAKSPLMTQPTPASKTTPTHENPLPAVTVCSQDGYKRTHTKLESAAAISYKIYEATTGGQVFEQADQVLGVQLKEELIAKNSIAVKMPQTLTGTYFVQLCDANMHAQCQMPATPLLRRSTLASVNQFTEGMLGEITRLEVQQGKVVKNTKGVVLLSDIISSRCVKPAAPLVVDLNGTGLSLSAPDKGVMFDITGDGQKEQISWPLKRSAMFLVYDKNGNGQIDSIDEMFSDLTTGANGKIAGNGFQALATHDQNGDDVIDAKDPIFKNLQLWNDINRNGQAEKGELFSMLSQAVVSFDLAFQAINETDRHGNQTTEKSVVTVTGVSGTMMRMITDVRVVVAL